MNKIDKKIDIIIEERKELLEYTKNNLKQNGLNLIQHIDIIEQVLNKDEENINKYYNILKTKDMIKKLSQEIINCDSMEQITKLRKKLNYYLNKVKKEIQSRNLTNKESQEYYNKTNYLRKDISKYLRFMKRENNLNQIVSLQLKENLTKEEQDKLKYLIKLEHSYNRKYLKNHRNPRVKLDDYRKSSIKKRNFDGMIDYHKKDLNTSSSSLEKVSIERGSTKSFMENNHTYASFDDYLCSRIEEYESRYNIRKPNDYNNGFKENVMNFFKNIPIYKKNKKNIKLVEQNNIENNELLGFIAYVKNSNSLTEGLKSIFKKTKLEETEKESLITHYASVEWIKNFCENNRIPLNYHGYVKQLVK